MGIGDFNCILSQIKKKRGGGGLPFCLILQWWFLWFHHQQKVSSTLVFKVINFLGQTNILLVLLNSIWTKQLQMTSRDFSSHKPISFTAPLLPLTMPRSFSVLWGKFKKHLNPSSLNQCGLVIPLVLLLSNPPDPNSSLALQLFSFPKT